MRLVYVVSQYPSLTETFVAREMEELVQSGNEIIVCPLRPPKKTKGPSGLMVSVAQVLRIPLTPWCLIVAQMWLLWTNPKVWLSCWRDIFDDAEKFRRIHHLSYILLVTASLGQHLQNKGVDHIRGHFLHSEAISSMWLSRIIEKPYSLTAHTSILRYPRGFIAKVGNGAGFIAGISDDVCNFVREIRNRDLYLIRNGIDLKEFLMKNIQIGQQAPIILAIGSLIEKKGFDDLINACALLKQKGFIFTCRIIGKGEERPRLEKLVRKLGLEKIVQMPGAMNFQQIKQEFVKATIFVMPSKPTHADQDGLPTVLIESMGLGTPVVSTRLAGIPDLVKDGETGLLSEPNNPVSLAECLQRLLMDQEMQKQFSIAGRRLVEKKFDIGKSVLRLLQLINEYSVDQLNGDKGSDCCS
jgi:glycosyltransferase involved in cell wall biosynthesis